MYQADPPAVKFDVRGVTIHIADPPINDDPPLFVETQAALNWLKWGKAPGICGIHVELLKAGGLLNFSRLVESMLNLNTCTRVISCSSVLCLERRHYPN